MIRILAFCSVLLISSDTVFAQKTIDNHLTINWKEGAGEGDIQYFKYEFFASDEHNLPVWVFAPSTNAVGKVSSVELVDVVTESINLPESDLVYLESDFNISANLESDGKNSKIGLVLFPFRKNETTGTTEKLISANARVTLVQESGMRKTLEFAENSVLMDGDWYKIALAKDGVYKIDRAFLQQMGIDVNAINPQSINIYGNGGTMLPVQNNVDRFDDLQKNAIIVQGENDGVFDQADFILFYGKGPDQWTRDDEKFVHAKHYYSDSAYYFLRVNDIDPKRINTETQSDLPASHTVNKFQDFQFIENDLTNLAKSGKEFFGDEFDLNTSATYTLTFPNITTDTATMDARVAARSVGGQSTFTFNVSGTSLLIQPNSTGTGATAPVANLKESDTSFIPNNQNLQVGISFTKFSPESIGWLDFIRINATRSLQMTGAQMKFRDTLSFGAGNIGLFQITSANSVSSIWDITDITNVKNIDKTVNGSTVEFKVPTDNLREFIAFANSSYLVPSFAGKVDNQNLHAIGEVDYVIVTAPQLLTAAEELAQIHADLGKTVAVVTAPQVFNEFSSGNPDVTAIKMLMKMLYDRAGGDETKQPKNLLLFGDGSYNNKHLRTHLGSNVITYESENSVSPTLSYVSDDYFVFLDDDDGEAISEMLKCGVGRIPASNLAEAQGYVNKVRVYVSANTSSDGGAYCLGEENLSPYGTWRNLIVFVSDDQDGSDEAFELLHTTDSDSLSRIVYSKYNEYDVAKIYMDAYKQEVTPGGERYPEGEAAIRQRVQNGALIVNYLGHGGERGWAHERILDIPTIEGWTNINRLPVFLTATCELARYDDPEYNSAGERLVMNSGGGAIAMLTTTRIVYSGSNFDLDNGFYAYALRDQEFPDLTIGELNMLAKNWVNSGDANRRNFSLLGDPALRIAYPKFEVYTTKINDVDITLFDDTLKALQEVEFEGYVGDADGNVLTDFDGFIYPTVYDKKSVLNLQNNDGGQEYQFGVFNKTVYKGRASVNDGVFSFKFVVPYDINYSVDSGRVSYYAVAGSLDGHGFSQKFKIGDALEGAQLNTVGPEISLYMNDSTFVSGGITSQNPVLVARLSDDNGINTVGNGIGHDLRAILDDDDQNPIVLNDFYEADLDTYKSGQIRYQLSDLQEGQHTVNVKVWDVHNNSSDASLEFVVASSAELALEHVLNYPNPFTTRTEFYFEHNQACDAMEVQIQVFTVGGKLVKTINQLVQSEGFRSFPIAWDGLDDFGDKLGRGVYVYRVSVNNSLGQKAEKYEKLVILQ